MDSQSAKRALAHAWAIVALARERTFTSPERTELSRIAGMLQGSRFMNEEVGATVQVLSARLDRFAATGESPDAAEVENLLDEMDRAMVLLG